METRVRSPFLQLVLLFALGLGFAIVAALLMRALEVCTGLSSIHDPGLIRLAQSLTSVCAFAVPVVVWHRITGIPARYGLCSGPQLGTNLGYPVLVMGLAILPSALLGAINMQVELPAWVQAMEARAEVILDLILGTDRLSTLMVNVLVVAVLPAVCEELLFRGAMQGIFLRWTRNGHAAVWMTAIMFSLVHMQFAGFLPRLFLGAVLGYLYLYTSTLWAPIVAHALNNALAVSLYFALGSEAAKAQSSDERIFGVWYLALISLALLVALFAHLRKRCQGRGGDGTVSDDVSPCHADGSSSPTL